MYSNPLQDQIYTTTAARKFKSSRDRPDICVHATFTTQAEAVKLIRQCMAKGLPLVFDDYPDSLRWACASSTVDDDPFMDPVRWSDDEVEGVVGANLLSPRDFQGKSYRPPYNQQANSAIRLHTRISHVDAILRSTHLVRSSLWGNPQVRSNIHRTTPGNLSHVWNSSRVAVM